MTLKLDALEFGVGHFDFLGVVTRVEFGGDIQAGSSGGAANQRQQFVQSSQRLPGPVQGDETEEPMLDLIPFRGVSRLPHELLVLGVDAQHRTAFFAEPDDAVATGSETVGHDQEATSR